MPGTFSALYIHNLVQSSAHPGKKQLHHHPHLQMQTQKHRGGTGLNPCQSVEYESDHLTSLASVFICIGKHSSLSLFVLRMDGWKRCENPEKGKGQYSVTSEILYRLKLLMSQELLVAPGAESWFPCHCHKICSTETLNGFSTKSFIC